MIVFDLDGTLALDEHRVHHLKKDPKDWNSYFAACSDDEPHGPIHEVLHALYKAGHTIGIWSGRSDSVRPQTEAWLERHHIRPYMAHLRMRPADDRTADDIVKEQWLREQNATGNKVTLVFEDRARVVEMWSRNGIVCCQVAPGDF